MTRREEPGPARTRRAVCAAALLLGIAAGACTTSRRQVTPWFRVDLYQPFMDQPVLIGEQAHETAYLRRGGKWVQVATGRVFATRTKDGRAVLFATGMKWHIARDTGEVAPLAVNCSFPAFHPTKPLVYCAQCGNFPPLLDRCRGTNVTELDLTGAITRAWTSSEPSDPKSWGPSVIGVRPDESIVIAMYGTCAMFAVGPTGTTPLGAGPRTKTSCVPFYSQWAKALEAVNAMPLVLSGENTW